MRRVGSTLAAVNLRAGPGTEYAVAGSAKAGQPLEIVGKDQAGTWWQWLFPLAALAAAAALVAKRGRESRAAMR